MGNTPSSWVVNQQVKGTSVVRGQIAAFKMLEGLQGINQGDQLIGVSMMLLMLCERFKQKPRDVLDTASYVLYDSLSKGKVFMNLELHDD